ncbi:zinc-ribbon domain-containing protein [Virgibacillus dakarensis]|uniref:Zinc-ribbon domain-containing protein n=1 Tax=Lentibacillus populi TaxID=1827502 RepID=A0A9W5TX09_9BACI|nr:zinc-ribbon domain-containing protein [Lentibacillus populi]MTW86829.1 zinc-ribbon domain-containing protein [Virgibacillus dakarensis]GGB37065.1 hypothetical protein GCM10011409_13140 [Lentibacillus populi]
MKFCKHCGGEISDNAKFCKHCGQDLTNGSQPNKEVPEGNEEQKEKDSYIPDSEKQTNQETPQHNGQSAIENVQEVNEKQGGLGQKPVQQPEQPDQPNQSLEQPAQQSNQPAQSNQSKSGGLGASKKTTGQPSGKKLSKKSKILMAVAGAVIVLLIVTYQVGASMTSKEKMVEKFEEAITKKDAETVADLLKADSKKIKINKKSVEGFINYYSENPSEFAYTMDHLKGQVKQFDKNSKLAKASDDGYTYALNLVEDGKKFLIYDNYSIQVSPVYFEVSTNYKHTDIMLNGEVIATSDKDDFKKEVGPFLPGTYKFTAKYKGEFVELTAEAESTNFDPNYSDNVELYIEGDDVTFYLPYDMELDNVKLYINGEDTGVNIVEESTFGPVLADGSMTASFEAKFPWGTMKTEDIPIESSSLDVEFKTSDELKETMKDTIIKFNQEYLAATTTADKKKLTTVTADLATNIVDDAKNAKEADQYYKGKFIGVDFDTDSFKLTNFGDGWTAKVDTVTIFEEDTWYGDDKPKLEKVSEEYGYELVYDKDSEQWKVNNIGWAGSMKADKMVEYREKAPKVFTSAWLK